MRRFAIPALGMLLVQSLPAQPCDSYACDTMVVREVLDANGITGFQMQYHVSVESGRMVSLDFEGATMAVLPAAIGRLSALRSLDLSSGHAFTSLPTEFGALDNLACLYLSHGHLRSLPQSFANLTSLRLLDLQFNELESLPDSIGRVSHLDTLNLWMNRLCNLDGPQLDWANTFDPDWREWQNCAASRSPQGSAHEPAQLRLAVSTVPESGGSARIVYVLPQAAHVDLTVHDLAGRGMATLAHGAKPAGMHVAEYPAPPSSTAVWCIRLSFRAPGQQEISRARVAVFR
jgi:hypothetical protein